MFTKGWIDVQGNLFLVGVDGDLMQVPLFKLVSFFPDEIKNEPVHPIGVSLESVTSTSVIITGRSLINNSIFRCEIGHRDLKQLGVAAIINVYTKIPVYAQTLLYLKDECGVKAEDIDRAIVRAIVTARTRPVLADITVH